ncbi:MAG: hypothetical protein ACE5GO_09650, partial [Anaerolineales bacterium]
VFFSGPATGKPPEPPKRDRVEMPQNPLKLYPTLDGLALRADPSIGGYLVGRLSEDAELLALGKKTNVKKKIGQYNQWLFVQGPKKQQVYVAAWYVAQEKGAAQAPPPKPSGKSPAPPKDVDSGMVVKPTTDGLAFRAKPAVSGNLIKRLPISSQLKVLEPAPRAARKLGVTGEWMRVSDVSGKKGYVAAWYVTDTNAAALGVKEPDRPAPTQDDDDLVVYGTADNLALRSRPVVADNTLIKRLPLQADLLVLKDSDKRKIGAQGQWIKVRDVTGAEGYVAAWYVTK